MMSTVRGVRKTQDEMEFEWTIPDFPSFQWKRDYHKWSPNFNFLGSYWNLQISLNDHFEDNSCWFELYLFRRSGFPKLSVSFTFSIKTANGTVDGQKNFTHVFSSENDKAGTDKFYTKSEMMKRFSQLTPSGVLTIICSIRRHDANCAKCVKETESPKKVQAACVEKSTHTATENHLPTSVMAESKRVYEAAAANAPLQTENSEPYLPSLEKTAKNLAALSHSFKAMLLHGECHDLTLKVKDKEFRAHQDILRVRSQVFESMLGHDMVEKNSGVISIPDCDPEAFEQFLLYVYSGKVENLSQSNMLGLYYIADKYDMPDLKEESREFIKRSLSTSVICDVIRLALDHSDSDILSEATDYFVENVNEILPTVEWQTFLKENSTEANELFMKAATYISKTPNISKT